MITLSKWLTQTTSLLSLDVSNNSFDVNGCKALCYALASNSSVKHFDMSHNNLQVRTNSNFSHLTIISHRTATPF